eukprot:6177085-Pleurochrysis_carterae.AAC.2
MHVYASVATAGQKRLPHRGRRRRNSLEGVPTSRSKPGTEQFGLKRRCRDNCRVLEKRSSPGGRGRMLEARAQTI